MEIKEIEKTEVLKGGEFLVKETNAKELPSLNIKDQFFSSLDVTGIITFLKLTNSKSEARRLIKNKGIKLNDKLVEDDKMFLNNTFLNGKKFFKLSLGKKKHYKIIVN